MDIDEAKRVKTLRNAHIALWVCPVALQIFGLCLRGYLRQPGFDAPALDLILPTGGVVFLTGYWYQAVQTVRCRGAESRNALLTLGLVLSFFGPILRSSYHDKCWFVFYPAVAFLLLFLASGIVAGRDSWSKRRKQNAI